MKKNKFNIKRVAIVAVCLAAIATLPIIILFGFISAMVPSVSEGFVLDYKTAADIPGCAWQDLVAFDTLRYENDFDEAEPYMSAMEFLTIYYEQYEERIVNKKKVWVLIASGYLNTPESIRSFFKLPEESDALDVQNVAKDYVPPEFVINIGTKSLDQVMEEHGFDEDKIEWIYTLISENVINEMFGIDSELPEFIITAGGGYFSWPTPELHTITSGFSQYRINPVTGKQESHPALDISGAGAMGSPIIAISEGKVTHVDINGGARGKNIKVEHEKDGIVWTSRYQHLSQISVSVGESVKEGEVIGAVGNTGMSTGAHLHIELTMNGIYVDPKPLILKSDKI